MGRQQARRHRRERLAGIGVVLLGAAVLVIALFALNQPGGHVTGSTGKRTIVKTISSTAKSTAGSSASSASSPSRPPSSPSRSSTSSGTGTGVKAVPLVVLNNTTTSQLASQAAQRFQQGGWRVTRFGNLPATITDIVSTCAYYDPGVAGAQTAATALQRQYPTIKRVKEKFSDLPAGPVVVVLTSDYSGG